MIYRSWRFVRNFWKSDSTVFSVNFYSHGKLMIIVCYMLFFLVHSQVIFRFQLVGVFSQTAKIISISLYAIKTFTGSESSRYSPTVHLFSILQKQMKFSPPAPIGLWLIMQPAYAICYAYFSCACANLTRNRNAMCSFILIYDANFGTTR